MGLKSSFIPLTTCAITCFCFAIIRVAEHTEALPNGSIGNAFGRDLTPSDSSPRMSANLIDVHADKGVLRIGKWIIEVVFRPLITRHAVLR